MSAPDAKILAARARAGFEIDTMEDGEFCLALYHTARVGKDIGRTGWRASARDALNVALALGDIGTAFHARELLEDGTIERLRARVRRLESDLARVVRRLEGEA